MAVGAVDVGVVGVVQARGWSRCSVGVVPWGVVRDGGLIAVPEPTQGARDDAGVGLGKRAEPGAERGALRPAPCSYPGEDVAGASDETALEAPESEHGE